MQYLHVLTTALLAIHTFAAPPTAGNWDLETRMPTLETTYARRCNKECNHQCATHSITATLCRARCGCDKLGTLSCSHVLTCDGQEVTAVCKKDCKCHCQKLKKDEAGVMRTEDGEVVDPVEVAPGEYVIYD